MEFGVSRRTAEGRATWDEVESEITTRNDDLYELAKRQNSELDIMTPNEYSHIIYIDIQEIPLSPGNAMDILASPYY